MSATPSCHRRRIIRLITIHKCTHTQIKATLLIGDTFFISTTRECKRLCAPKTGSSLKTTKWKHKRKLHTNCLWGMSPHTVTRPPSSHMAVFSWNFTQLGWGYVKPPFVFLSIIMFALSWSYGFSSGKFAAAPLPPTWLTDVWLLWYTGISQQLLTCFLFFLFAAFHLFILPSRFTVFEQCKTS